MDGTSPRGIWAITGQGRDRVRERLADPSPLDLFLTARWRLHQAARGRTLQWPVEHEEWPLHRAEVVHLADELIAAAGLPVTGPPDTVHWSPGVAARFGPRRRVLAERSR